MDQHPWLDAINNDLLILVIPAALCLLAATAYLTMRAIREIEDRKRWKKADREQAEADREAAAWKAKSDEILGRALDDGPIQ